jgi:hypothetical protein
MSLKSQQQFAPNHASRRGASSQANYNTSLVTFKMSLPGLTRQSSFESTLVAMDARVKPAHDVPYKGQPIRKIVARPLPETGSVLVSRGRPS